MKRLLALLLAAMLLALPACNDAQDDVPPTTTAAPAETDAPVVTAPTTTAAPAQTDAPAVTVPPIETTAAPVTTVAAETTAAPVNVPTPFVNPLTGLPTATDLSQTRPAAVMINNLRVACPQVGIAQADVLYECLVEGGITRLMAVIADYTNIGTLGSVRSSRDYYLDMAQNHDALYFHAGGSPQAYAQIHARGIDYICGVNMYTPNTFYRDQTRLATMGTEHSLMTSGDRLKSGVAYKKYRTAIKEGFSSPFAFGETDSAAAGQEAKHLILNYSTYAVAQMIYSETQDVYYRFQFGNVPHIDGATGEQLSFTNVILLYHDVKVIPGDTSGRLEVTTVGEGAGYYVSGGRAVPIKWAKADRDAVIQFCTEDGAQLVMSPGKTFVGVLPTTANVVLNHK